MTTMASDGAGTAAAEPAASPDALPRTAATGGEAVPPPARKGFPKLPRKARTLAITAAALTAGAAIGAGATAVTAGRADASAEVLARLSEAIEAGRSETARLSDDVERFGKGLASLRDVGEGIRSEGKARGATTSERIARLEQGLGAKLSGLADRMDQSERNQIVRIDRLTTQIEKRPAVAQPAAPPAEKVAHPEPAQTGSLGDARSPEAKILEARSSEARSAETKPKQAAVETWALREVYGGVAMLEDRRRRLVEVAPGDTVPGIGRVEAIERRGRNWVVVTRQGLITPQAW